MLTKKEIRMFERGRRVGRALCVLAGVGICVNPILDEKKERVIFVDNMGREEILDLNAPIGSLRETFIKRLQEVA